MVKYRKKTVVVEVEGPFYIRKMPWPKGVKMVDKTPKIQTSKGLLVVAEGDMIITEVSGERYPCDPDVFELTYEYIKD